MSQVAQIKSEATNKAMRAWFDANPAMAMRGIDESTWTALCTSVYPGAKPESVLLAVDYCNARGLDVMLKPVHLVPMSVKNAQNGNYEWRDVPMPGVGLYRIQAERTGNYAGAEAPEMGPDVTKEFQDKNGRKVAITFPEWCKYTVHKIVGGRVVSYTALEYWEENYATDSKDSTAPNSMWKKRPRGQLAKCAEAQALRKGWPEIGQEPTAEEMEGKAFEVARDITPAREESRPVLEHYPADRFEAMFPMWEQAILTGKKSAADIIAMASSKGVLTAQQEAAINNVGA